MKYQSLSVYKYFILINLGLAMFLCGVKHANARQSDTAVVNNKRLRNVVIAESSIYGLSMTGLYQLWYKGYPKESFHFFNDNNEWLQMDKLGHAFSAYYVGLVGMEALRWSGVDKTKSIWLGGGLGFIFLSTIEVFDGFSGGWGFSTGDMMANMGGYLLCAGQQQWLNKQIVMLKFSYSPSPYATARPNVLGSNYVQSLFKDYNGQTYWLSFAPADFMAEDIKFPKWLSLAVGYSASGMYGGFNNIWESKGVSYDFSSVERKRELLFSLDINLWRVKTRNRTLNNVLKTIGFIKVPFPAYEFMSKKFYPFYF